MYDVQHEHHEHHSHQQYCSRARDRTAGHGPRTAGYVYIYNTYMCCMVACRHQWRRTALPPPHAAHRRYAYADTRRERVRMRCAAAHKHIYVLCDGSSSTCPCCTSALALLVPYHATADDDHAAAQMMHGEHAGCVWCTDYSEQQYIMSSMVCMMYSMSIMSTTVSQQHQ